MMIRTTRICTRILFFAGAFLFFVLLVASLHSTETEVRLSPPGLRPISRPTLVIPAGYSYPNRAISLPDYCDESGNPAAGWSAKYIDTRRFASDQSGWVYFRNSDLKHLVMRETAGFGSALRIWPIGSTLIIEIFKGHASLRKNAHPIEIAVMSKLEADPKAVGQGFYTANWSYARFKPAGSPFITPSKVHECHQCHSIAFHLTGDLIFTKLP
jgi:hypothetical protein